jgi:hypothetical protein
LPPAEFSEDEFEDHLIGELQTRWGRSVPHFKPSRLLENGLGYDFALLTAHPALHGPGISLHDPRLTALHSVQRKALIPNRYVSTFIQVKRPFRVHRRSSNHKGHWDHWGGQRHFRISLDREQVGKLEQIESQLGSSVVVRVASPCFWQFEEIDAYFSIGGITERSHFQRPVHLTNHDSYSYQTPLESGYGCSDPQNLAAQPLLPAIVESGGPVEAIADHIYRLYFALRSLEVFRHTLRLGRQDERRAELALGDSSKLPLFPLGRLGLEEERDARYWSVPDEWTEQEFLEGSTRRPATLGLLAQLIFAVKRLSERELNSKWLIFFSGYGTD